MALATLLSPLDGVCIPDSDTRVADFISDKTRQEPMQANVKKNAYENVDGSISEG